MVTDVAPASAVSTATARAAPPAPTHDEVQAGRVDDGAQRLDEALAVGVVADQPPVGATTVLTAPITSAEGARPSRWSITVTLCGSEQLKPAQPIARAPATASASASA